MQVEYAIQCNYGNGYGWEVETVEDTREEAQKRLKEYQENSPYPVRIVKQYA